MALSSSSARLSSAPESFCNPCAGGCAWVAGVVWAAEGNSKISIPKPISSPNRNMLRRAVMMGLIRCETIGIECLTRIPIVATW